MTKTENALVLFLKYITAFLILLLGGLLFFLVKNPESQIEEKTVTEIRKEYVFDEFLTRKEINETIKESNDYFFYLGMYENIVGDRKAAKAILDESIETNVPVNLAFSLAFVESRFDVETESKANRNGTIDRGLFQLNSATFSKESVDWFDVEENTKIAMEYLKEQKEKFGSWESAIIMYNAGLVKNLSERSLNYITNVLNKERELDEKFNTFRRNISDHGN